jgi:hypothetical protein
MHVQVERLTDEELSSFARVYNDLAGRDDVAEQWRAWARELTEAVGLELASRIIKRAEHNDPLGYCWFGRL